MDLLARLLRRLLWLHRRRRGLAPPHAPLDLLCLLAREAGRVLLPPPAQQPAEEVEASSVLAAILSAGLRRLPRGPAATGDGALAPPGEAAHPLLLPVAADADARRRLLRLALARIHAGAPPAPLHAPAPPVPAPVDDREQFDRIVFGALVHWARRVAPPPTEPFLLRLFLRLPERQSRRLLPPTPSARAKSTILRVLFYLALRRLGSAIPREKDAALLDFVSLLRPLSLRLLPSGSEEAHADIPAPPPRAPARLRPRAPTPAAAADDGVHLLIRHALARFPARGVAARVAPIPTLIAIRLALDRTVYVLTIHVLAMMSMQEMRYAAAAARAAAIPASDDATEGKLEAEESVQVVLVSSVDEARAMIRDWESTVVVDVPPHLPREEALIIDNVLMRSPSLLRRGPVPSLIIE